MSILAIMIGVPGSGKSTIVKKICNMNPKDFDYVSRDEIRFKMLDERGLTDYFAVENEVVETFYSQIQEKLDKNPDKLIFADATHTSEKARKSLLDSLNLENVEMIIALEMDIPLETCLARNAQRTGREQVPIKAIINMYKAMKKTSILDERIHQRWVITDKEESVNE